MHNNIFPKNIKTYQLKKVKNKFSSKILRDILFLWLLKIFSIWYKFHRRDYAAIDLIKVQLLSCRMEIHFIKSTILLFRRISHVKKLIKYKMRDLLNLVDLKEVKIIKQKDSSKWPITLLFRIKMFKKSIHTLKDNICMFSWKFKMKKSKL